MTVGFQQKWQMRGKDNNIFVEILYLKSNKEVKGHKRREINCCNDWSLTTSALMGKVREAEYQLI